MYRQIDTFEDTTKKSKFPQLRKIFLASTSNMDAIYYLKSTENIVREQRRQIKFKYVYTIHPFSNFKYIWTSLMCFVIYILPIAETFALTFEQKDASGQKPKDFLIVKLVILTFAIISLVDFLFDFMTGYWNPKGRIVELSLRAIAMNNIRSLRFYRNLLFNTPSYFIALVHEFITGLTQYGPVDNHENLRDIASIITIVKVWRFVDVTEFLLKKERYSIYDRVIWKFINLLMYITVVYHMSACLVMNVFSMTERNIYNKIEESCDKHSPYSWIVCEEILHIFPQNAFARYFKCLVNASSTLALFGEGDKINNHSIDRVMIVVLRLIGMWIVLYVINYISIIVRSSFTGERKYQMIKGYIEEISRYKKLPNDTKKKMLKYFEYKYDKRFINEWQIMTMLPTQLRTEVIAHCKRHIILDLPYFADLPEEIIQKLSEALRTEIYLPNDLIIKQGTIERALFILAVGTASTSAEDEDEELTWHAEAGSYFGQTSFIDKEHEAEYSVTSVDICEFKLLYREDFKQIMMPHKQYLDKIEDMIMGESLAL